MISAFNLELSRVVPEREVKFMAEMEWKWNFVPSTYFFSTQKDWWKLGSETNSFSYISKQLVSEIIIWLGASGCYPFDYFGACNIHELTGHCSHWRKQRENNLRCQARLSITCTEPWVDSYMTFLNGKTTEKSSIIRHSSCNNKVKIWGLGLTFAQSKLVSLYIRTFAQRVEPNFNL